MNIELDELGRPKYNERGDRILYPRQWVSAPENTTTSKLTPYQRKIIRERQAQQEEEKRKALSNTNALLTNESSKLVTTPVKTKKTKSKHSEDIPTPGIDFSPISPGFVATPSIFEKPSTFEEPSIFDLPYFVNPEMESSVPKRLFSEVSDDVDFDLLEEYEKGGRRKSRKNKKSRKSKKSRKTKKSRKLRRKH